MNPSELEATAHEILAEGKGILAADESLHTMEKRFKMIQVESTEENRRWYREMLFSTPGIEQFISGVILFDETIRQNSSSGKPLREILTDKKILPGIKVDQGTKDLANFPGEKITEGLDGLRERLLEYRDLGARFTKWRAVITIGDGIPSDTCIDANAECLARYAALSQETGLVPIVEPEVLMDGNHTLGRTAEVTFRTLRSVFAHLLDHRIHLEGMILKPNMVLPGKESPVQASVQEMAKATVDLFREVVPAAVPGIAFLSGGQEAVAATEHLNAMNQIPNLPWRITFSYSRALEEPVLRAWAGDHNRHDEAQRVFFHRAQCNGLASQGRYTSEIESKELQAVS